ncbi:MAG: DUF3060 domain-containing protein [Myxococcus sp.]|nr:DUF3060 domain-containing protein [Myxococcus sp.]
MRLLLIATFTLSSSLTLAQVKVQTGPGGTKVDTGAAGVEVETGPNGVRVETGVGTKVKTGSGAGTTTVKVKTGQGSTTVQAGGVRVETGAGSVNVAPPPPPAVVAPAPVAEAVGDDDDDLVIQDDGRTIEHTCGNEQQIIVNGSQNVITLHGPCKDVHVNGEKNRITTDSVQSIVANGDTNQIQWRTSPRGKAPKVSTNGNGNTVSRLR